MPDLPASLIAALNPSARDVALNIINDHHFCPQSLPFHRLI